MEQPCYKCGQTVQEGVPFCVHCSAPQIRVAIAEPVPHPVASPDASTTPASVVLVGSPNSPGIALPMQWSQAIRPCALAALVASLLMMLGLNPFVAMLSVGFLAVVFYRQRQPGTVITAATGARIGAFSGLLWFAVSSILEALIVLLLHKGPEIRNALVAKIQQAASQTSDPQTLAVFDRFRTPGGLEFLMIVGVIFAFFASIVLAGLGGTLGGAILSRRGKN